MVRVEGIACGPSGSYGQPPKRIRRDEPCNVVLTVAALHLKSTLDNDNRSRLSFHLCPRAEHPTHTARIREHLLTTMNLHDALTSSRRVRGAGHLPEVELVYRGVTRPFTDEPPCDDVSAQHYWQPPDSSGDVQESGGVDTGLVNLAVLIEDYGDEPRFCLKQIPTKPPPNAASLNEPCGLDSAQDADDIEVDVDQYDMTAVSEPFAAHLLRSI